MKDYQEMKQTTSLKTKMYQSELEWVIDNFKEYPESNVKELTSELVAIKGFMSSWELTVFPKQNHTEKVGLRFKIYGDLESVGHQTLVKFEVKADVAGYEMMSPANRHLVRERGHYAEPTNASDPVHIADPAIWSVDYSPIRDRQEFSCDNFIEHENLIYYLAGDTLTLNVNCYVKTVEVVNVFKKSQ